MNTIQKLTLRSLLMNKSRTAMTIVAIMLSCALITIIAGMGTSGLHSLVMAEINFSGDYDVSFDGSFNDDSIDRLSRNRDVDGVYYERPVGISNIPEPKSVYKPYMLVHGLSKGAMENCFNAKLKDGRLPENDGEIVLSPMFIKYSKKTYHVGDKLTLSLGDRRMTADSSESLYHWTSYNEGEYLDSQKTKEYIIVGILDSVSRQATVHNESACVDVFTLSDNIEKTWTTKGFSGNVGKLYVSYTQNAEKNYVSATAQIIGISEEDTIRHFDNDYSYPSIETISKSNSFGIRDFYENKDLLEAKGIFRKQSAIDTITLIAVILIFIVMGTSVFIIRNSISISATEKTRLFGMLSSVGATPKQIQNSVLYEGLLLTITGVPLGIAAGLGVTFALTNITGELLKSNLNGNELIFSVPLWTMAAAALLGAATVFLSSVSVAITASKVTPIEAVRQSGSIQLKTAKKKSTYKTPKLISRLFGEGGVIAWKNMKRSKRQYRVTVVSLAISTILFLSVSTFVEAGFKIAKESIDDKKFDIYIHGYSMANWDSLRYLDEKARPNRTEEYRQFFEKVAKNSNVQSYNYGFDISVYRFIIPEDKIYSYQTRGIPDIPQYFPPSENRNAELDIVTVDDQTYAEIVKLTGKTAQELKGKAIILNYNRWTEIHDDNSRTITYPPFLNEPEGMILHGSIMKEEDDRYPDYAGDRGEVTIEIGAAIDSNHRSEVEPYIGTYKFSGALIMQINDYMNTIENWYTWGTMQIMAEDAVALEADIGEMSFDHSIYVENMESYVESMNALMLVVQIFVYGFIAVITLISITNIFNTVTTNMKLRQREMAMLRSIGMTNREFDRMIILESIFCSGKALFFGIPLGLFFGWIVCFLMDMMTNAKANGNSCYVFPITETIICAAAVMLIVGIMMYYSVSKIRKQNIIETIRNENI